MQTAELPKIVVKDERHPSVITAEEQKQRTVEYLLSQAIFSKLTKADKCAVIEAKDVKPDFSATKVLIYLKRLGDAVTEGDLPVFRFRIHKENGVITNYNFYRIK